MMIEWKKSDTFESSPCDPMKCNPKCPQCGDTPSCGDGSWSWGHGKHRHRCRDAHPQSGHDDVLCNTHDGPFIIDRLTRENADHAAELARVEKERDSLGYQYNDFMRALGVLSLGIDAEEWSLPSAHGNDRLRWAVLICQKIERLKTENTLLRAECEAARVLVIPKWQPQQRVTAERLRAVELAYATARADTDAANILKGAGT